MLTLDTLLVVLRHLSVLDTLRVSIVNKAYKETIDKHVHRFHFANALNFQLSTYPFMTKGSVKHWVQRSNAGTFELAWRDNTWQAQYYLGDKHTLILPQDVAFWRYALYTRVVPEPKTIVNMSVLCQIPRKDYVVHNGVLSHMPNEHNMTINCTCCLVHVTKWVITSVKQTTYKEMDQGNPGVVSRMYAHNSKSMLEYKPRFSMNSNFTALSQSVATIYLQACNFDMTEGIEKIDNSVQLVLHNVPTCVSVTARERVVFTTFQFCMACRIRHPIRECLEANNKEHRLLCKICLGEYYVPVCSLNRTYLCSNYEVKMLLKTELIDYFMHRNSLCGFPVAYVSKTNLLKFLNVPSWSAFLKTDRHKHNWAVSPEYQYRMHNLYYLQSISPCDDVRT